MSRKCSNCGKELNEKEKVCPDCGYELKDEKTSEHSDVENSETTETTSNFTNKEVNENIEWSELKDMSLGHVMNMFNEHAEPTEDAEPDIETCASEKETPEKELPAEEKKVEEKEIINGEKIADTNSDSVALAAKDVSPLHQYIKEHKTENNIGETTIGEESEEVVAPSLPLAKEEETQREEIDPIKEAISESEAEKTKLEEPEVTKSETAKIDSKQPVIPSKSKKPEEIEMDAAPIFYKEVGDEKVKTDNSFKEPTINESESKSKKKNRKRYVIAASVVILATGGWFTYDQVQKNSAAEKKAQTEQLAKQKKLAITTKEALENYFTDNSHVYIKPAMIGVSTTTIEKNLDELKDNSNYKELKTTYDHLTSKQAEVSKVNELFAQPVINGSQLNDVAIIADKKVELKKIAEKDALDNLVNQAIDEATKQYDQLQKAKETVAVIYKENKTTDKLTLANYDVAKAEVAKVKSAILRKPLTDNLFEANKVLVEAQQKEVEAQAVAATPNQTTDNVANNQSAATSETAQNTSGFTPPNSDGIYTDPVYTVNPSDVADMSNPAWSWAPGIREKVIATSIERGYIVEGGYTLEPVRIINGEGYYNLYGTTNQSQLLSGFSEKDFPVYLVTINAKTGWFKGNASRNAGG